MPHYYTNIDLFVKHKSHNHSITEGFPQLACFSTQVYDTAMRNEDLAKAIANLDVKTSKRFTRVDEVINSLDTKTERRFVKIDGRFERIEQRLDAHDKRFDQLDRKIDVKFGLSMEQADRKFTILHESILGIHEKLDKHIAQTDKRFGNVGTMFTPIGMHRTLTKRVGKLEKAAKK